MSGGVKIIRYRFSCFQTALMMRQPVRLVRTWGMRARI
ncbi:hypothetical protein F528_0287 [Neisseria meningitidis 992008]|nr:hypothetical protein F528_0287 [Neisseria meningitidis 992008]